MCSDIRILIERMIETDLLSGVLERFRRAVHTVNKLNKLAKINEEDCKFIDELMTKYSRYEHSQPDESPVELPDPDELQKDMDTLRDWREEFVRREEY